MKAPSQQFQWQNVLQYHFHKCEKKSSKNWAPISPFWASANTISQNSIFTFKASQVNGKKILALYFAITLESQDFNTTQTQVGMFLKTPYVYSADIYFLWAVDVQNK